MKRNLLTLVILVTAIPLFAASTGEQLAASLERHLQSLKSLEIQYQAVASGDDKAVEGRMILVRPNLFYHETPEWTVCRTDDEQWRYLKTQNTLILESASEDYTVSPQSVLFNLQKNFRVVALDTLPDGHRELKLDPSKRDVPGHLSLEFPSGADIPDALVFSQTDGGVLRYTITRWQENVKPDPALFTPPSVPPENRIDFRGAGKGQ
jgi:outer membrane lipoprotein-sorting protein